MRDWDAVAERFLKATGNRRPRRNARALAVWCGYELWPGRGPKAFVRGGRLYFDTKEPWPEQQRKIAEVVARLVLRRERVRATREGIAHVAARLLASVVALLGI